MGGYKVQDIILIGYKYIKEHPGCTTSKIYHLFIDEKNTRGRTNRWFPSRRRIAAILKMEKQFRCVKEPNQEATWYIVRDEE